MRRSSAWKYFADFFPIKLVKTAELSPDKNYIFGTVLAVGASSN